MAKVPPIKHQECCSTHRSCHYNCGVSFLSYSGLGSLEGGSLTLPANVEPYSEVVISLILVNECQSHSGQFCSVGCLLLRCCSRWPWTLGRYPDSPRPPHVPLMLRHKLHNLLFGVRFIRDDNGLIHERLVEADFIHLQGQLLCHL